MVGRAVGVVTETMRALAAMGRDGLALGATALSLRSSRKKREALAASMRENKQRSM